MLKKAILGDFKLDIGQGLLHTYYAAHLGALTPFFSLKRARWRPSHTSSRNGALQGAALHFAHGAHDFLLYGALQPRFATLHCDEKGPYVAALPQTTLVRSQAEAKAKGRLQEQLVGAAWSTQPSSTTIWGGQLLCQSYSHPLKITQAGFQGKKQVQAALFGRQADAQSIVAGEVVVAAPYGLGVAVGVEKQLAPYAQGRLLLQHFDAALHTPHGSRWAKAKRGEQRVSWELDLVGKGRRLTQVVHAACGMANQEVALSYEGWAQGNLWPRWYCSSKVKYAAKCLRTTLKTTYSQAPYAHTLQLQGCSAAGGLGGAYHLVYRQKGLQATLHLGLFAAPRPSALYLYVPSLAPPYFLRWSGYGSQVGLQLRLSLTSKLLLALGWKYCRKKEGQQGGALQLKVTYRG